MEQFIFSIKNRYLKKKKQTTRSGAHPKTNEISISGSQAQSSYFLRVALGDLSVQSGLITRIILVLIRWVWGKAQDCH